MFRRYVRQALSFSDLVSDAVSGRCLHQTPIEAQPSLSDGAVVVETSVLETIAYPHPFLVIASGWWSQFVAGFGEGQTRRTRMPMSVERDRDPINAAGKRVDVT